MNVTAEELEGIITRESGVHAVVEEAGGEVVLTGMVNTEGERQTALDLARQHLEGETLVDNIEVVAGIPEELPGMDLSVAGAGDFPAVMAEMSDDEAIEAGDFMDQDILENAEGAAGPTDIADIDQDYSEGEEVYVPPTDPPSDGANEVIGGFQTTSMDPETPVEEASPDTLISGPADEALRDAVIQELREDSMTTALDIRVIVRNAIVHLHGVVDDLLDAEAAEEVAGRVRGVRAVREELELRNQ